MSKIAELLKLAEKKKEENPTNEILPLAFPPVPNNQDHVNNERIQAKSNGERVYSAAASKGKQKQVWVSKSKQAQVSVSKRNRERASATKINQIKGVESQADKSFEISPSKDFTKVSNSIAKRAIPEKYFRGLSKHTYDVLYQLTRGAINPTRTVQLTKDELVRLTGISKDAVKLHIKYLKETGLLESRPAIGCHVGWEYEIYVPEEIEETGETVQVEVSVSKGNRGQNLPLLTPTNLVANKGTYAFPNTSFKTNTDDDDDDAIARANALSEFAEKLDAASKKITGKGLSVREKEKWGTLADLFILELETAAKRTDSISSIPAFLTEVLRKQFFASRQQPIFVKTSKTKIDTVGKPETDSYEIKPLDRQGRYTALRQLQEFAEDEFLQDFKKWYTEEDWKWLTKRLKIK